MEAYPACDCAHASIVLTLAFWLDLALDRPGWLDLAALGAPARPGWLDWDALGALARPAWLDMAALSAMSRPAWLDLVALFALSASIWLPRTAPTFSLSMLLASRLLERSASI